MHLGHVSQETQVNKAVASCAYCPVPHEGVAAQLLCSLRRLGVSWGAAGQGSQGAGALAWPSDAHSVLGKVQGRHLTLQRGAGSL